jgi:hypothetical protein
MRTVGQRRREAEQKLDHHLEDARHKSEHHTSTDPEADAGKTPVGEVDGTDVVAIQDDDRLTAADRVDLIANQRTGNQGHTTRQRQRLKWKSLHADLPDALKLRRRSYRTCLEK